MLRERVRALGSGLYRQSLKPYKPRKLKHVLIFGLDTEYWQPAKDSPNELISWQLSLFDYENTRFYTSEYPLTWDNLYQASKELLKEHGLKLGDYTRFVYAVFLGTAEVQWLQWTDARVELYGTHQVNLTYQISKRRKLHLFDLQNWAHHEGLARLASTFGLKKLKYDVANLLPGDVNDPDFIEYAKNDAYIQGEILRRLRDTELSDSGIDILLSKTAPSTAAADFRNRHIPKGKHYGQRNTVLRRRALEASWGGWKECYFRGVKDNVREYDAKSCYPMSCIAMGELPLGHNWRVTHDLDKLLQAKGGFGTVIFEFPPGTKYPCLPVGTQSKIYRPLKGTSDCSKWEIEAALEMGCRLFLVKGYYYKRGVTWLADYLKTLLEKRAATTDPVLNKIYKLKANSIIGKLTQKRQGYDLNELIKYCDEHELDIRDALNTINLPVQKKLYTGSLFYPEWNTLILGYARAAMARAIVKTNALQVATDAVFTEGDFGDSFDIMGIKFECKDVTGSEYIAYRSGLYEHGHSIKHQGMDYRAAKSLLEYYSPGKTIEYEQNRITSIKEALKGERALGQNYQQQRIANTNWDDKRELLETGETIPLEMIRAP